MKDYYDLYKILQNEKYNPIILQEVIKHRFENATHLMFSEKSLAAISKCKEMDCFHIK